MPRKKASPTKAKVTFNLTLSYSDLLNVSEGGASVSCSPKNVKKKKIYREANSKDIILGTIRLPYANDTAHVQTQDTLEVLCCDLYDVIGLKLKVTNKTGVHTFDLNTYHIPMKLLKDLLTIPYKWVLGGSDEELVVSIARHENNFLIYGASHIVEYFFKGVGIEELKCDERKKRKEHFFEEVKKFRTSADKYEDVAVNVDMLLPTLRAYQTRAVKWMMFREEEVPSLQTMDWVPSVLRELHCDHGGRLYYNKYSDALSGDTVDTEAMVLPKGGILADEMGLGKTVTVIALVLNHLRDMEHDMDIGEYLVSRTDREVVRKKNIQYVSGSVAENNKESCMTPTEELIASNAKKSMLKTALNSWYEALLAEYKAPPTKKRKLREAPTDTAKCVCGGTSKARSGIQCPECLNFQHEDCVGYREGHHYYCPSCWIKQKKVKSRATLIVSPASICHQWVDEIEKHVAKEAFVNGVLVYTGVRDGFIQPSVLATYDIVITTYDVLRAEINHATSNDSTRTLRNEERFLRQSSPLTQVQWWRLCLDEAQMVESPNGLVIQMAKLIPAVNLWAVTGTPIQKSIQDLYYLIEYLGVQMFSEPALWRNILYLPFLKGNTTPLCSVIGSLFWRSSKEEVADDLLLPNQTIEKHFLRFTAIEESFYLREHTTSSTSFADVLRKNSWDADRTIDSMDKQSLTRLLAPLLNLRQACSHPQAVHGSKITTKTGSMTLSELLTYMCSKTKLECEDAMRKHISALNGLAGISCILEHWNDAVEQYRNVLRLTEEYKDKVNIDSLQRIHTMTNLAEILSSVPGIPPTLRDDSLKAEAQALEDKYMGKSIDDLASSDKILLDLADQVLALEEAFETGPLVWWNRLLNHITIDHNVDDLIDRINSTLSTNESEKKSVKLFTAQISSVKGLEIVLRNWVSDLEENREKVRKKMKALKECSNDQLVEKAVICHLRTFAFETKQGKCPLCLCESVLLDYECVLFSVTRKELTKEYEKVLDGAQTKGSWKSHNAETALRAILGFSNAKNISEKFCIRDGRNHVNLLATLKKEFKQLRVVWKSINHQVQARDELSMSKFRLRLRLPDEPLPPKQKKSSLALIEENKIEVIHIIDSHEVESQRIKLQSELCLSLSEFKKKHGTLMYLKNLGSKGNALDPCPVCKSALENEWCVLQCGHSYCIDCVHALLKHAKQSVQCPVCREYTKGNQLSFVDLSGRQEDSDTPVVGEHSTKVESIVRAVLKLRIADPSVKILIFSSWAIVLKILGIALEVNEVSFRRVPGNKYKDHLQQFRDPRGDVTVLLLPISWGSKGLNLVEATHVFLVEPIMNPADELQAIGRVHRIGQTRETVVHRFLMNGTIEEKIYASVSEAQDKWDNKKVTVGDLQKLFVVKETFRGSD